MSTAPIFRPSVMYTLVCDSAVDPLYQASCCLSFISRMHSDLADWKHRSACSGTHGPDEMIHEEHRGLSLFLECARSAVGYEIERRDA